MEQFLSTFTNKIDRKGRVSVPAEFRAVLTARKSTRILMFPAVHLPAVEGAGDDYLAELDRQIASLPPLSQERDDLVHSIKPFMRALQCDPEGRVMLGEEFIAHADLGDLACFVGVGESFQIWNPKTWDSHRRDALARSRSLRTAGRS